MSDHTRRKFLGAAAALPLLGDPSAEDDEDEIDGSHLQQDVYAVDFQPPEEDIAATAIEIGRAWAEAGHETETADLSIKPTWEPDNTDVASFTLRAGCVNIASGLGRDEALELIDGLQHAIEVADKYSESEI